MKILIRNAWIRLLTVAILSAILSVGVAFAKSNLQEICILPINQAKF